MEIIRLFAKIFKAPVIAGAFVIFAFTSAEAAELWPDRPHPAAPNLSIKAGASYIYRDLTGYGSLEDSAVSFWQYDVKLTTGAEIPLLSRLYWSSTADTYMNPSSFEATKSDDSAYSSLIELKSPFTVDFLSYDTRFFLQYRNNGGRYGAKYAGIVLGNGQRGSEMTLGERSQFFALAIDTPVTGNDSGDSYSRFGLYYQADDRLREASVDNDSNAYLLGVTEHHFGLFIDIAKPVFVEGFLIHTQLQLGYGLRSVNSNSLGFDDTDFEGHSSLFLLQADIDAAYRFAITEKAGLTLLVGYRYNNITVLQSGSSNSGSFEEDARSQFQGSLMFDVAF